MLVEEGCIQLVAVRHTTAEVLLLLHQWVDTDRGCSKVIAEVGVASSLAVVIKEHALNERAFNVVVDEMKCLRGAHSYIAACFG